MRFNGIIWLREIIDKLAWKHAVTPEEVEQVLEAARSFRFLETGDVEGEDLYFVRGQTDEGRYLVVFFLRKRSGEALVVSARDMTKRERKSYAK
jgi:uncharacterized DUF497 family protein